MPINLSDTSHIQACREAWHKHYYGCKECAKGVIGTCEQGAVLYGEYQAAITANPSCEHLEATCATKTD